MNYLSGGSARHVYDSQGQGEPRICSPSSKGKVSGVEAKIKCTYNSFAKRGWSSLGGTACINYANFESQEPILLQRSADFLQRI
jgi:hypothetical protein